MAQAVERILGKDEVGGSSPPISSMIKSPFSVCGGGGDFYFALTRLAKSNPEYAALQNDYEAQQKILAMFNKALEGSKTDVESKNSNKYALKEKYNSNYDFDRNISKVVNMTSVADLGGSEFAKGSVDLITQVTDYFNSIGNVVHSKYGDVIINRTGIKSSVAHGIGRNKAIAFKAVPDVIENGEIIDYQQNYKGRSYDTAVFAAPILIGKDKYFVAAVVNVNKNSNEYYLHEIALSKKIEDKTSFKTGNSVNATPSDASSSIYSLLETLQKVNSDESENVKFSLKEPAEETKDLIAVHNITTANMRKALDLGGFPMPSIAVMKARQSDANADYGEISVVFGRDTVDPESSSLNKVYGGDAWTPRFPRIDNEIDYDKALDIYNRAYELSKTKAAFNNTVELHPDNIEDGINRLGLEKYLDNLKNDYTVKQFYLLERGEQPVELQRTESRAVVADEDARLYDYLLSNVPAYHPVPPAVWKEKYEPAFDKAYSDYYRNNHGFTAQEADNALKAMNSFQKKRILAAANRYSENGAETVTVEDDVPATKSLIDSRIDKKAFEQWVDDTFAGIVKKQGIRNNAEPYTSSGDRRSFDALHYEVTLENIVKQMKSQRNGEETLFSGLGIWGVAAKNYGTIEELKADSTRLQNLTDEEYSAIKQGFGERLNEIAMALNTKYGSDNPYIEYDNKMTEILEALRYSKTKSGVLSRLNGYFTNATESTAEDLLDLVADIGNMPAQYFEAKPQRAVGFDEIAYVVIPDNADDGLKSALTGNGIEYREYEAGNEQSRVDVLNSLDDVKFSRKEKLDEFDAGDYNGITLTSKEYNRLYSEAMTWDAGKTNQILSRSLNGYRYYYSFDDEYNMSVISKEKSINIHEVDKNAYKNANKYRERNVSIRGNGRNNRSSIDASERASTLPRENAPNVEGQIRREGRGYRAGYDEDGDYDNLQKEKRYSLKEPEYGSEIFIENEELADAAESLQEMLRYVSAENNELRSAFDIKTDSLCKKQSIKSVGTNKSARLRVGAAISSPYD